MNIVWEILAVLFRIVIIGALEVHNLTDFECYATVLCECICVYGGVIMKIKVYIKKRK